jgi:hypothetical protein
LSKLQLVNKAWQQPCMFAHSQYRTLRTTTSCIGKQIYKTSFFLNILLLVLLNLASTHSQSLTKMLPLLLLLTYFLSFVTQAIAQSLNVTTLAVQNGSSVLECWSLGSPTSGAGAQNYPLGDFSNAFIGAIPPHTYIGQAWPSSIQYFFLDLSAVRALTDTLQRYSMILHGLVHISLPNSKDETYIQPGPLSTLLVIDERNISIAGHITEFPGSETTLIAQFPVAGNQVPAHTVLHSGPCDLDDVRGLVGQKKE